MPIIPALGKRRRQKDCEFRGNTGYIENTKASLAYIARSCSQSTKQIEPSPQVAFVCF